MAMSEINWRRSPGLRSGFTRIDSAPAPRPRPRKSEQGGYALLLVLLMAAIIAINGWNRLAIATRMPPGTYEPKAKSAV